MADTKIKGAYEPNRVYSVPLNAVFDDDPNTKKLIQFPAKNKLTSKMFALLDGRRSHYFIDYSFKIKYHEEDTNQENSYAFFPLSLHKGRFGLIAIACSDSRHGRKLITEINAILANLRTTDEFKKINSRWLMPKGQEHRYWQLWDEEILSRAK